MHCMLYNNVLHSKILNMIEPKHSKYEFRGLCLFEGVKARTTTKIKCVSIEGVNLWRINLKCAGQPDYLKIG